MHRWAAFRQLLLARLREFYREPEVLFWVYGFPLFLAAGLGLSFSGGSPDAPALSMTNLSVDVQGGPGDAEAAALQKRLEEKGITAKIHTPDECLHRLVTGRTSLYVVPDPHEYGYYFDRDRPDGLMARYRVDDVVQRWKTTHATQPTKDHEIREPGQRYIDFLIPGLMGLNLMGGGLWGVGFVIVDMRVRKVLKWYLATPMRRSDFLLSVLASRLVFMLPEMLALLLFGCLVFGMPFRGRAGTLAVVILAGGAAFAGLGLLLATRTEKTETVSGLINAVVLPMWMLCGTFFSPKRFPEAFQPLIHALPLTQLNDALREVILEGATLGEVATRVLVLAGWAVVAFVVAVPLFRWH